MAFPSPVRTALAHAGAALLVAGLTACSDGPVAGGAGAAAADATPTATDTAARAGDGAGGDGSATVDTGTADTSGADASTAETAALDSAGGDTGPTPSGLPFAVGLLKFEVAGPGKRALPTLVWYPTPKGSKGAVTSYLAGLIASPLGAIENAAPAPGPFPTVTFSHGNQGVPDQSVYLTEGLAARGYVVVAPEHVGNSFLTYDDKLLAAMVIWRPQDLKAAVDRLAKPDAKDPTWLKGLADTEKLAVAGHSFGGYTALAYAGVVVSPLPQFVPKCAGVAKGDAVCDLMQEIGPPPWNLGDPRVDLSIPLAHALTAGFDVKSLKEHQVPIVLAAAKGDAVTPYASEAKAAYDKMDAPKALLTVENGGHFSFAHPCELAAVAPPLLQKEVKTLCAADASPSIPETHGAVLAIAAAACDVYLKGNDARRQDLAPGPVAGLPIALQSVGIVK